jgi:hypothetical protein
MACVAWARMLWRTFPRLRVRLCAAITGWTAPLNRRRPLATLSASPARPCVTSSGRARSRVSWRQPAPSVICNATTLTTPKALFRSPVSPSRWTIEGIRTRVTGTPNARRASCRFPRRAFGVLVRAGPTGHCTNDRSDAEQDDARAVDDPGPARGMKLAMSTDELTAAMTLPLPMLLCASSACARFWPP